MDSHAKTLARTAAIALAVVAAWAATTADGALPRAERAEAAPVARFALDGPRGTVVRRNLRFGPLGASLDLYRRAGTPNPAPAVLVVHGGGWTGGGKRRMHSVSIALARHGFVAVNVGYELAAPGYAGFPRQPRQLRAAIRWVRRNADRLGVDRERIGALGSSAGAHLAALAATQGEGPLSSGARLSAVVGWSAPLDLPPLAGSMLLGPAARTLVGCGMIDCPERWIDASPLTHVSPDDPPMLLANSLSEMVPAGQAERMADRLASAGVPHELLLMPGHRHARDYGPAVMDSSLAFLRRWLSR